VRAGVQITRERSASVHVEHFRRYGRTSVERNRPRAGCRYRPLRRIATALNLESIGKFAIGGWSRCFRNGGPGDYLRVVLGGVPRVSLNQLARLYQFSSRSSNDCFLGSDRNDSCQWT
jgi:hypothetical protein